VVTLLAIPTVVAAKSTRAERTPTAVGTGGAAATVEELATEAAIDALRHGANAVDAAVVASRTPPESGAESRPSSFPQEHLRPDKSVLVWDVVRYVRRDHRDLYREFLHERTIYDHVVDYLAQTDRPTLTGVVADLRRRASEGRDARPQRPDAPGRPALRPLPQGHLGGAKTSR